MLTEDFPLVIGILFSIVIFSIVIFIMWTFSANEHMDGWIGWTCYLLVTCCRWAEKFSEL